jgi:hypothetical protein
VEQFCPKNFLLNGALSPQAIFSVHQSLSSFPFAVLQNHVQNQPKD